MTRVSNTRAIAKLDVLLKGKTWKQAMLKVEGALVSTLACPPSWLQDLLELGEEGSTQHSLNSCSTIFLENSLSSQL